MQAIEAELAAMFEQYSNVKTIDGRRAVVRNGYLPEREIVTAVGPVPVQVPKVRDRSGSGIKFNSAIVPPYHADAPRVHHAWTPPVCQALMHGRPQFAKLSFAMVKVKIAAMHPDFVSGTGRRSLMEFAG